MDLEFVAGDAEGRKQFREVQSIEDPENETVTMLDAKGDVVFQATGMKPATGLRFPLQVVDYVPGKSNYEHMKALDARLGDFKGVVEFVEANPFKKLEIEFSNGWALNKNFFETHYRTKAGAEIYYGIAGWDPDRKKIRIWSFGSNGVHGDLTEIISDDGSATTEGTIVSGGKTVASRSELSAAVDGKVTFVAYSDGKKDFEINFHRVGGDSQK